MKFDIRSSDMLRKSVTAVVVSEDIFSINKKREKERESFLLYWTSYRIMVPVKYLILLKQLYIWI